MYECTHFLSVHSVLGKSVAGLNRDVSLLVHNKHQFVHKWNGSSGHLRDSARRYGMGLRLVMQIYAMWTWQESNSSMVVSAEPRPTGKPTECTKCTKAYNEASQSMWISRIIGRGICWMVFRWTLLMASLCNALAPCALDTSTPITHIERATKLLVLFPITITIMLINGSIAHEIPNRLELKQWNKTGYGSGHLIDTWGYLTGPIWPSVRSPRLNGRVIEHGNNGLAKCLCCEKISQPQLFQVQFSVYQREKKLFPRISSVWLFVCSALVCEFTDASA